MHHIAGYAVSNLVRGFVVMLGLLVVGVPAFGAVPSLMNYQGVLRDGGGNPVADGAYTVTFTIHDALTGGTVLWTEVQSITTVDGLFTVLLGGVNPIADAVFAGSVRYLGLAVSPDPEMVPRQRLVSVGYAYRVSSVDSALGGTITTKVSIGPGHTNTGANAFVAGANNQVTASEATVGGGGSNTASGVVSTVGGGFLNEATGHGATVGGGDDNMASGVRSTVGGGIQNSATGVQAAVSGGFENIASGLSAAVGGGSMNKARGNFSVVAGGGGTATDSNAALAEWTVVGGGFRNRAVNPRSTISGGAAHTTSGDYATIGGGHNHIASGLWSTISGGDRNVASGVDATVSGGGLNTAGGDGATIAGGGYNSATGLNAVVGGGAWDTASADFATVAGGRLNVVTGVAATIGGGDRNQASALLATVAGGDRNIASNTDATVGGGAFNIASGGVATVSGGITNVASGEAATIPGGSYNTAAGNNSLAAGYRAKANHLGAYVWADSSVNADFASTGTNQYLIRAAGGVGINTTTPTAGLQVLGGMAIGAGTAIQTVLSATGTLDFPNTAAAAASDLAITVTGASAGDVVSLGVPGGSVPAGGSYFGWVSAANTVTIRFSNATAAALNPASGTFRAMVTKF